MNPTIITFFSVKKSNLLLRSVNPDDVCSFGGNIHKFWSKTFLSCFYFRLAVPAISYYENRIWCILSSVWTVGRYTFRHFSVSSSLLFLASRILCLLPWLVLSTSLTAFWNVRGYGPRRSTWPPWPHQETVGLHFISNYKAHCFC